MLAAIVLLTGCESTTAAEVAAAERYCASHGGLKAIPAQLGRGDWKRVTCGDDSTAVIPIETKP